MWSFLLLVVAVILLIQLSQKIDLKANTGVEELKKRHDYIQCNNCESLTEFDPSKSKLLCGKCGTDLSKEYRVTLECKRII